MRGLRATDKRARSGSPFRLFGTASVGSQSLTGIARLHRLRNDPKLASVSAVWPFETGWAAKAKWLPAHVLVLHAEIYPSVRDPLPDEIKDRGLCLNLICGATRALATIGVPQSASR